MTWLNRMQGLADMESAEAIQLLRDFAPDLYHAMTVDETVERVLLGLAECVDQATENPADV